MKYEIKHIPQFSIIGQEILLTNSKQENILICKKFWNSFNSLLKKFNLSQKYNWEKYGFITKKESNLYYFCAIPSNLLIPPGFIERTIENNSYLVFEHIGSIDKIYETYWRIYKEILPNTDYVLLQNSFTLFEKYNHKFYWNIPQSIIEIWIPINPKQSI